MQNFISFDKKIDDIVDDDDGKEDKDTESKKNK